MAAGGRAAETIVTDLVRPLLGDAAETVEKDLAKDAAKSAAEHGAEDAAETAGKDAVKDGTEDAGKDAARDSGEPLEDGEPGRPREGRTETEDPIDVATGEVLFSETDLSLPGVLPLVFERTHISSYRQGGLYGISWASTLDQRLEITSDAIRYAAPDGTIRAYPPAFSPGIELAPLTGPVRPLTWVGADGYVIDDPRTGHRLHFPAAGGVHGWRLPIAAISDRNGNRITFHYDQTDTLTEVRHSGGYRVAIDTDGPAGRKRVGALRLLTSAEGDGITVIRYGYDRAGHLSEVTNSSGLPLRFFYDGAGRMAGWKDRNDHEYHYDYDDQGRAVRGHGTGGYLNASLTYESNATVLTDSLGHRTTYHLNERRQVIAETNPLGHTTTTEWDDRDQIVGRTDPLGHTTRYTYDLYGNRTQIRFANDVTIRAEFDELSNPVRVAGPDGAVWRNTYDQAGNLIAAVDPVGATTRYTYDDHGAVTGVIDAFGETTRIEVNAAGLPIGVTDPLGATTNYRRDAFGRMIAVTDPAGGTTQFGWTIEGRLGTRILPSGATETWEYDPEGNPITYVDAIGQVTRTAYGPFDLPVSEIHPDNTRRQFGYDTELRPILITNPQDLGWRYDYDSAGNLVQETDFGDRIVRYAYDPAGRLSRQINGAGETVEYVRDALGNVTEERFGDQTTTFSYDAAGRLLRAVSPDADLTFEYDPLGRILAESCDGRTLASGYDVLGRRTHRRTPSGNEAVWTYDLAGRPVGLASAGQTLHFSYDAAGNETRRHIGAGAILDQRYDVDHQLISQALWGAPARSSAVGPVQDQAEPRLLQHRTYTRRPDGYVNGIDDRLFGHRTLDMDRAGRVTAVNGRDWREGYAYDRAGNLVHTALSGQPDQDTVFSAAAGGRVFSGSLVRSAGRIGYDYDAQGRLIRRRYRTLSGQTREWNYTWNARDRLTSVSTPDGRFWRYRYDPLGRRIAKQLMAPDRETIHEETLFTWDGPHLAEQTTRVLGSPESVSLTWDRDGLSPVVQSERRTLIEAPQHVVDERFFAIVTDLVGTPTELVSAAGDVAWRGMSTLWGTTSWNQGATAYTPLRFPGQYFDPETGLHYNYFRYYDPATALYTSPDPLGLEAGPHPRAYVLNPLSWIDYLGLLTCSENAKLLGENMAREGRPVASGQAAAHIVPSGMNRGGSASSRALLQRYGVDINDAANGMRLGHPRPHNFTHRGPFLRRVNAHLQDVVRQGIDQGLGARAIRSELRGALRDIGRAVESELATGSPGPHAIWTR